MVSKMQDGQIRWSAADSHRDKGSGCSRRGYGWMQQTWVWHNPTILLSELTQSGETDSWRAQTELCVHRTQEKGAVTPEETDPDLPMSVQESPAEAWVSSGLLQGWGH